MSDFLSAAATHIQGAASAVNQAFWDGMELQGQAEITNAQANLAMGQGLVNAFPYAVDQATSWGEAGLVRGTIIGGVAGGVIGGAAGTVTVPGVGTGVRVAGGAYVGGEGGLIFGTIIGGTAGFFNGLVTAPSWNGTQGPQVQDSTTQNPAVAAQGGGDTGATSPGTGLPQGLAGELGLGLGGSGLVLAQGTGPTSDVWQTAGNSNQQSADQQGGAGTVTVVAGGDDSGSSATGGTVTGGSTADDTGTYQTAGPDPTPVTDPTDLDS